MSKDTHTKGKWTKWKRYDGEYSVWCDNKDTPKRTLICEMNGNEGEANAKHIVQMHNSFEDTLQANKDTIKFLDSLPEFEGMVKENINGIRNICESAIAKAEETT